MKSLVACLKCKLTLTAVEIKAADVLTATVTSSLTHRSIHEIFERENNEKICKLSPSLYLSLLITKLLTLLA